MDEITPQDARAALAAVERSRLGVIGEIDLPGWYWWSVALGWVALGVVTDLRNPWLTSVCTLLFGAAHSTIAARVADGRHRSDRVSVSAAVAGTHVARWVFTGLIGLAVVTVAGAIALSEDGARHPVTETSVAVAVAIVLGGPLMMARIRQHAARRVAREGARS
jgi:uncharacterized membrane protein